MIELLKELREKAGLTQEELAKRSGVSLPLIFKIEQGSRSLQRSQFSTLVKLAGALGCSVEELVR